MWVSPKLDQGLSLMLVPICGIQYTTGLLVGENVLRVGGTREGSTLSEEKGKRGSRILCGRMGDSYQDIK